MTFNKRCIISPATPLTDACPDCGHIVNMHSGAGISTAKVRGLCAICERLDAWLPGSFVPRLGALERAVALLKSELDEQGKQE
jgi:hypothetical protein